MPAPIWPRLLRLLFLTSFRVLKSQTWIHKQWKESLFILDMVSCDDNWLQTDHAAEDGPELLIFLPLFIRCWDYSMHLHALFLQCWGSNSMSHVCYVSILLTEQHPQPEEQSLRVWKMVTLMEATLCRGRQFMQMLLWWHWHFDANSQCWRDCGAWRLFCLQQADYSLDSLHLYLTWTPQWPHSRHLPHQIILKKR